eukprot:6183001-Pleurochrysis_carterae.AAC.3
MVLRADSRVLPTAGYHLGSKAKHGNPRKDRAPIFSTPPVRVSRQRASCADIHEFVTYFKEHAGRKRFRKAVREILRALDE